jgi:hypothetical protein
MAVGEHQTLTMFGPQTYANNLPNSLHYKKIKSPAPHEGAGHSQGERRLLVIRDV